MPTNLRLILQLAIPNLVNPFACKNQGQQCLMLFHHFQKNPLKPIWNGESRWLPLVNCLTALNSQFATGGHFYRLISNNRLHEKELSSKAIIIISFPFNTD